MNYDLKLLDDYVAQGLLRKAEDEDLVQYNYSEKTNNEGLWDEVTMFNRGNVYEKKNIDDELKEVKDFSLTKQDFKEVKCYEWSCPECGEINHTYNYKYEDYCNKCNTKVELKLKDRIFECPNCKTKEDRDIHAANNMIWFYLKYKKLDRSGTDQTSIKGPVKITYNKFISNLAKQEDTTSLALC